MGDQCLRSGKVLSIYFVLAVVFKSLIFCIPGGTSLYVALSVPLQALPLPVRAEGKSEYLGLGGTKFFCICTKFSTFGLLIHHVILAN